jgi:hypothetical protein
MKSVNELREAFAVYYAEMDRCEQSGAYWALLHLLLVMPDICAALEFGPRARVKVRYLKWCSEHFSVDPALTPDDRFQIRNAVLHEGSTLPNQCQYRSISFVETTASDREVHLSVTTNDTGRDLTLDVKLYADQTRAALDHWFESLQNDKDRNHLVSSRLGRIARLQLRKSFVPIVSSDGSQILTSDGHIVGVAVLRNGRGALVSNARSFSDHHDDALPASADR